MLPAFEIPAGLFEGFADDFPAKLFGLFVGVKFSGGVAFGFVREVKVVINHYDIFHRFKNLSSM